MFQFNSVKWMFGLVDRATKEIRIFYVGDDRSRNKLLPIIKKIFIRYLIKLIIIKMKILILFLLEFTVIVLVATTSEILIIWALFYIK